MAGAHTTVPGTGQLQHPERVRFARGAIRKRSDKRAGLRRNELECSSATHDRRMEPTKRRPRARLGFTHTHKAFFFSKHERVQATGVAADWIDKSNI